MPAAGEQATRQADTAGLPYASAANLPRYNINRVGTVSATDLARLVQLLNGVNTTQSWTGAIVAACP